MASFEAAESISLLAGEDLSAKLYQVAKVDSAGAIVAVAAVTDTAAGIVSEAVALGDVTSLALLKGRVKVKADGTVAAGNIAVISATGGILGVATLAAIPIDQMGLGVVLTAGVANDIVEMLGMPIAAPHTA